MVVKSFFLEPASIDCARRAEGRGETIGIGDAAAAAMVMIQWSRNIIVSSDVGLEVSQGGARQSRKLGARAVTECQGGNILINNLIFPIELASGAGPATGEILIYIAAEIYECAYGTHIKVICTQITAVHVHVHACIMV